jgi:phosphoribosylformylglycinamidine synthase
LYSRHDTSVEALLNTAGVAYHKIGEVKSEATLTVKNAATTHTFDIDHLRDVWFKTSYLLDQNKLALLKRERKI